MPKVTTPRVELSPGIAKQLMRRGQGERRPTAKSKCFGTCCRRKLIIAIICSPQLSVRRRLGMSEMGVKLIIWSASPVVHYQAWTKATGEEVEDTRESGEAVQILLSQGYSLSIYRHISYAHAPSRYASALSY